MSASSQTDFLSTLGVPPGPSRGHTAPYQKGSDTSEDAAKKVLMHLTRLQRQVMLVAYANPAGFSSRTIEQTTSMKIQSICPRLVELCAAGKLRKRYEIIRDKHGVLREKLVRDAHGCAVYLLGPKASRAEDLRG